MTRTARTRRSTEHCTRRRSPRTNAPSCWRCGEATSRTAAGPLVHCRTRRGTAAGRAARPRTRPGPRRLHPRFPGEPGQLLRRAQRAGPHRAAARAGRGTPRRSGTPTTGTTKPRRHGTHSFSGCGYGCSAGVRASLDRLRRGHRAGPPDPWLVSSIADYELVAKADDERVRAAYERATQGLSAAVRASVVRQLEEDMPRSRVPGGAGRRDHRGGAAADSSFKGGAARRGVQRPHDRLCAANGAPVAAATFPPSARSRSAKRSRPGSPNCRRSTRRSSAWPAPWTAATSCSTTAAPSWESPPRCSSPYRAASIGQRCTTHHRRPGRAGFAGIDVLERSGNDHVHVLDRADGLPTWVDLRREGSRWPRTNRWMLHHALALRQRHPAGPLGRPARDRPRRGRPHGRTGSAARRRDPHAQPDPPRPRHRRSPRQRRRSTLMVRPTQAVAQAWTRQRQWSVAANVGRDRISRRRRLNLILLVVGALAAPSPRLDLGRSRSHRPPQRSPPSPPPRGRCRSAG